MSTGVYPLAPAASLRLASRRLGVPAPWTARAVASEWALAVASSAARPLGFAGLPRAASGPRPIVLLHGYAMGRSCFLLLARRLARAGLGPLYGFEYWSLGKTGSAARRLGEFVDEVRGATGAERVDLIGHSMGGLVARYYATLGGGRDAVAHVITLGSPHGGTDASAFGFGRAQVELVPGSVLLDRMARAPLGDVDLTVIWSRADALVWSERQARVPGAREIVFDDLGHIGLLASRRVARRIVGIVS